MGTLLGVHPILPWIILVLVVGAWLPSLLEGNIYLKNIQEAAYVYCHLGDYMLIGLLGNFMTSQLTPT